METVLYEVVDGVAKLTLNRPDVLNSLNTQLIEDIRAAIAAANEDKNVGAILMTGAGRGFCAGADLASGGPRKEGASTGENVAYGMEVAFNPMVREIAGSTKPVIAAVNGITAGGGVGLALSADIVIAGKSASFVQVFGPQLALIPDMGCTWYLPNLVGRARARGLALLGEKLPAERAAEWGLIWQCVEDDALMDEAMKIAAKLAGGPSNAFGEIKRALDTALTNDLSAQLDYERDTQGMLGDHPNFAEGVTSFLQKRKPNFQ
jgi:2-(1,2-epoxy-1,2-dihydrophenyl)acetyl-CoA isomerase